MSVPRPVAFTGAGGNRLAADLWEGGPRVALLLHGGGQTRHAWEDAARRLAAAGWTVVSLDQRGHGESAWSANGHYTFGDFAQDTGAVAREIARRFGLKPVIIGASLGGIAALLAQGEAGEPLCEALILVDITPRIDPSGVAKITGFMRRHAEDGFASLDEAAEAVSAYLSHRRRPASIEGLHKNLRLSPDGRYRWHWDPRFLDGTRSVSTDPKQTEQRTIAAARALRVPTLLVRGGRSELVAERHAREFLDLVPQARLVDVSEAHHMVAGDRNDAFTTAVLAFLSELVD